MAAPDERSRTRLGYVVAGGLALIPLLRMASVVRQASALQYSDYWLLISHFTNTDGSLRVAGLFEFEYQNHVVVLPMLAYWLNAQLFAGSNVALGVAVLVLGLALLGMVGLMLWRSDLPTIDRMVLFVLSSCLIFTPNGAWNYALAMSGTAWLGAGLLGVIAVYLRGRDHPVLAFGAAILAALTYATGLMVWPALVAVGCCRRPPREWWKELPFVAGFVANYLWFKEVQTTGLGADLPWPGPVDAARVLARLLAFPLGLAAGAAEVVGFALLAATVVLVVWAVARVRTATAAMWVGVAVFGVLGTLSLAYGRYIFISSSTQNRYASVPVLALIGLSGLVLTTLHGDGAASPSGRKVVFAAVVGVLGVAAVTTSLSGAAHVRDVRGWVKDQELREVALHLGLADGNRYLAGYETAVTDLLVDIDHQPFDGSWDRDCGLIDRPLPDGSVTAPAGEITHAGPPRLLPDAVELTGYVDGSDVRCVVVTGDDDTVLGAATLDVEGVEGADEGDTTFTALARAGQSTYRAWAIADAGGEPRLIGEIAAGDLGPTGQTQAPPGGSASA